MPDKTILESEVSYEKSLGFEQIHMDILNAENARYELELKSKEPFYYLLAKNPIDCKIYFDRNALRTPQTNPEIFPQPEFTDCL